MIQPDEISLQRVRVIQVDEKRPTRRSEFTLARSLLMGNLPLTIAEIRPSDRQTEGTGLGKDCRPEITRQPTRNLH